MLHTQNVREIEPVRNLLNGLHTKGDHEEGDDKNQEDRYNNVTGSVKHLNDACEQQKVGTNSEKDLAVIKDHTG